jgi:predicted phosphodiesterase
MRVAALYDIHGNLPALEAVVQEMRHAQVDQVVVGGDVIPGPMPLQTLEYLYHLDIPTQFIRGNCEVAVLDHLAGTDSSSLPEQAREAIHWTAQQLPADLQRLIASWPATLRIEIPGLGPVMFCHATPRSETECFTRLTPEDRLLAVFSEPGISLIVCGHTHMQFDRMVGNVRVVNAGSVGMPFGQAGAYWLLLGPDVQLRHTHYDLEEAASRIRDTNYPQSQDFALNNVLNPPSEEAMLQVFSRSEL